MVPCNCSSDYLRKERKQWVTKHFGSMLPFYETNYPGLHGKQGTFKTIIKSKHFYTRNHFSYLSNFLLSISILEVLFQWLLFNVIFLNVNSL